MEKGFFTMTATCSQVVVSCLEQAIITDGDISVGPTLSLGLGSQIFLRNGNAVRAQLQDDFILQSRSKTGEFYLKQNVTFSIGYVLLQK